MPAAASAACHCARRPSNRAIANETAMAPAVSRLGGRAPAKMADHPAFGRRAQQCPPLATPLLAVERLDAVEIEEAAVEPRLAKEDGDSAAPRLPARHRLVEIDNDERRRQGLRQRLGGAAAAGAGGPVEMQQEGAPRNPRLGRERGERARRGAIGRRRLPGAWQDQFAKLRQRRVEPALPEQAPQKLAVEPKAVGEERRRGLRGVGGEFDRAVPQKRRLRQELRAALEPFGGAAAQQVEDQIDARPPPRHIVL